ncbi:MAG TPA: hypothetical protein VFU00_05440 [Gemmatimonadales bacterium]|nr:hypothetical protein [Gemmatimonadales bacterium]
MSVRKWFGIDGFDLFVHVVITALLVIIFGPGLDGDPALVVGGIPAASLLVLSWRRRRALARGPAAATDEGIGYQLEEIEQRLVELDGVQQRVLELEERLEFTERLLARQADVPRLEGER